MAAHALEQQMLRGRPDYDDPLNRPTTGQRIQCGGTVNQFFHGKQIIIPFLSSLSASNSG